MRTSSYGLPVVRTIIRVAPLGNTPLSCESYCEIWTSEGGEDSDVGRRSDLSLARKGMEAYLGRAGERN
jgi:hypothetical protein